MANENKLSKKHSDFRVASTAKAGKRSQRISPPEPKVEEKKAKWIAMQVINGTMDYDTALRQVQPNSATQAKVEDFLKHMATNPNTNPVIQLRIKRYL